MSHVRLRPGTGRWDHLIDDLVYNLALEKGTPTPGDGGTVYTLGDGTAPLTALESSIRCNAEEARLLARAVKVEAFEPDFDTEHEPRLLWTFVGEP